MKKIIVVTKCIKYSAGDPGVAQFSFKGYYRGHKIICLEVSGAKLHWEKNQEYVIYLGVQGIEKNCILGQALKAKKLQDFLMDS